MVQKTCRCNHSLIKQKKKVETNEKILHLPTEFFFFSVSALCLYDFYNNNIKNISTHTCE